MCPRSKQEKSPNLIYEIYLFNFSSIGVQVFICACSQDNQVKKKNQSWS